MKNDRVCWIDSLTIKRGRVLVFDGSLMPFCSKYLDTCMRANDILKSLKKGTTLSADCLSVDGSPQERGQSGPGGRTVRSSNSILSRDLLR
jgi:hypothetical protein